MPTFFSSTIKAGIDTTKSFFMGPSKTLQEMHAAQQSRYKVFINLLSNIPYTAAQQQARKQYWCSQIFFLDN